MWLPIGEVHDGGRRFNFACIEWGMKNFRMPITAHVATYE
jgi:hypothetical protein